MNRDYIRSFGLDNDTGEALNSALDRLRMSGSELVNRLLMEYLLNMPTNTLTPPLPEIKVRATMIQRAKEIRNKEKEIRG